MIFEDGAINKSDKISEDDLASVEAGYLQIIRVSSIGETEEITSEGNWLELEELKQT